MDNMLFSLLLAFSTCVHPSYATPVNSYFIVELRREGVPQPRGHFIHFYCLRNYNPWLGGHFKPIELLLRYCYWKSAYLLCSLIRGKLIRLHYYYYLLLLYYYLQCPFVSSPLDMTIKVPFHKQIVVVQHVQQIKGTRWNFMYCHNSYVPCLCYLNMYQHVAWLVLIVYLYSTFQARVKCLTRLKKTTQAVAYYSELLLSKSQSSNTTMWKYCYK